MESLGKAIPFFHFSGKLTTYIFKEES